MAVPTVMYESDTWIVGKNHETRIQTAELKCLREAAGFTSTYQQHNTEIREN